MSIRINAVVVTEVFDNIVVSVRVFPADNEGRAAARRNIDSLVTALLETHHVNVLESETAKIKNFGSYTAETLSGRTYSICMSESIL